MQLRVTIYLPKRGPTCDGPDELVDSLNDPDGLLLPSTWLCFRFLEDEGEAIFESWAYVASKVLLKRIGKKK